MSEQWTEEKRDKSAKMFADSIYRVMKDIRLTDKQKVEYLERIDHFIDLMECGKE